MRKIILALAGSIALFACNKDKDKEGTFKSQEVQVHGGKSWTWVKLDKDGNPQQLGLTLNDAVLSSVPTGTSDGGDHIMENTFIIPFHQKGIQATPFQFVMLNWNPNGHEPAGIYDRPHFDIHFYMTPADSVMKYTDIDKIDNKLPAAAYLPPTYQAPIPGVPMMGKHWIDVTSPELNGQPFTQTFIYGSYDSKVVFYEPMITLDFLKNNSNFERAIPQPAKFGKTGFYPTKMRVLKHDGVTEIVLDNFVKKQAS